MTRDALVRSAFLFVTIDAETHLVVHDAFRHRHLGEVAMTSFAIHPGSNVRRVIESDVRLLEKSINPLPRQILAAFCMLAKRLYPRIFFVADILMTAHAE